MNIIGTRCIHPHMCSIGTMHTGFPFPGNVQISSKAKDGASTMLRLTFVCGTQTCLKLSSQIAANKLRLDDDESKRIANGKSSNGHARLELEQPRDGKVSSRRYLRITCDLVVNQSNSKVDDEH